MSFLGNVDPGLGYKINNNGQFTLQDPEVAISINQICIVNYGNSLFLKRVTETKHPNYKISVMPKLSDARVCSILCKNV